MPQLDPRFFASQFFWIIICFALFYACVHFVIVPRIRAILDMRGHVNEKNKTTANMLSLQIAELKAMAHSKTMQLQHQIDSLKFKSDDAFQEYVKNALGEFNDRIKSIHEATKVEIADHQKILAEKATSQYVASLADKIIVKFTGMRS